MITRAEAMAELERRACSVARQSFSAYLALMFPHTAMAAHHQLIAGKLQDVADGKLSRLMLFLPPGSAKSTYANGRFIPWYLGANPGKCAILATHTATFSEKWGRRSRAIASAPSFRAIFDCGVDKTKQAAGNWELDNGSEYMATGVGGAVTGNRADLIVIDDPVKGREDADSQTMRAKAWDWYLDDLHTRLKPGGAIVLIMTRWHEDDLAGRLLADAENGGEQWDVVSIPAQCESLDDPIGRQIGDFLWPEWFRAADFELIKRIPRTWSALYQQRPAPEEGAYFKRDWLKFYDDLPANLRYYGASDYAVTDGGGDYTVHGVIGVDVEDNIYLVDLWRKQSDSLEWVEAFIQLLKAYKPQIWAEEAGVIVKSMGPIISKRLTEERVYSTYRKQFTSAVDKPSRARSLQARLQMGKIFFPTVARCSWIGDLLAEFLTFPAGKNDDQVDMLSLICRMLDSMVPIKEAVPEPTLHDKVDKMINHMATFDEVFKSHVRRRQNSDAAGW